MIKQVKLGSQGLTIPTIGLGCMGMTGLEQYDIYGKPNEQEAITTIHRSLELRDNFLDNADPYGPLKNERLVAKATQGQCDKYIIASKFGFEINDQEELTDTINGRKEYVRKAAERCRP